MKKKTRKQKADARRKRFVAEYLKDLNATKAALRAGYSKKTARSQGQRLLTNVDIAAAIRTAMEKRAKRTGIDTDRVLYELEHLAFSNIEDYQIDEHDRLVLAPDAPKHAMRAVSKFKKRIKPGEFGTEKEFEISLWDKPGTLKLAGRHVGLFADRLEVTGKNGKPIEVEAIRAMSDEELKARVTELLAKL